MAVHAFSCVTMDDNAISSTATVVRVFLEDKELMEYINYIFKEDKEFITERA